ncbi:hypothetical protein [Reinekea thalattae]|uniref:Uncharacterized protein n=1 Tax=Reinekea thalattae TaxID=2593301 RepID=A0A5C8Z3V3_9GAMM|nr:hypothetical protein [Reinekea thalattae]TXR51903.1 hypothetical protein FME95_10785 [Reinekea thalattae]
MKYFKLNGALLAASIALVGCGAESGSSFGNDISLTNPIADMTLSGDTRLNFSIPDNTCTSNSVHSINYEIDNVADNVGFSLNYNSTTLSGYADDVGEVTVSYSCSVLGGDTLTDEFTITVVDFDADPVVTISADQTGDVRGGTTVTLTADAEVPNLTGEIDPDSYNWEQNLGEDETGTRVADFTANGNELSFDVPAISSPEELVFEVTVADAADEDATATATISIRAIPQYAPEVSISFPLSLGEYSASAVDMFGVVEAATGGTVNSVTVTIDDGVPQTATVTGTQWRVEDVTLPIDAEIKVVAVGGSDENYAEISLDKDTFYSTSLDNDLSDIAVDEINGYVYAQVDGATSAQVEFLKFDLGSAESSVLDIDRYFSFSDDEPTSISIDAESQTLFVGYATGATKINLATGDEAILYNAPDFTDENGDRYSGLIADLFYHDASGLVLSAEANNSVLVSVDPEVVFGDRTPYISGIGALLSTAIDSSGNAYFSQGYNVDGQAIIQKNDGSDFSIIYDVAAGSSGGPVSDIAINENGDSLYFVNGAGDLIKLALADNSTETVLSELFDISTFQNPGTPLIGLHYDSTRQVLIAAGRDFGGSGNKLLVIDPETWNYAKIAEGN